MNSSTLLVREGEDADEFDEILEKNFRGNVTNYMEAAMRIFSIVLTEEVSILDGENLVSIVDEYRHRDALERFAKKVPFRCTRTIKNTVAEVSGYQPSGSNDEQSIFYNASRTYQLLVEKYIDGAQFVDTARNSAKLDFGGVLELVHPFELCDEDNFYFLAELWLKLGENNSGDLSPAQIEPMLKKLYKTASESDYPRREILKMYQYQEEFKKYRHLKLV